MQKRLIFSGRLIGLVAVAIFLFAGSGVARAQASGGPVPIDKAAGKTGTFQVILTERSPLSKATDVAQRTSQKVLATDADYDLAKEPFETFVPKSAGNDGKYGLMIPMPFGGHGFPPPAWIEVLERHHLIWLGNSAAGDGRSPLQRIGLALDAVHNAQKVWPIDVSRVYICPASASQVASGIGLYYPEVFQGQICSGVCGWYANLTDPRTHAVWRSLAFPQPKPEQLGAARSHGRFFFAARQAETPGTQDEMTAIVKEGYQRTGFKHVKAVYVPPKDISVWSAYAASWFEQGVEFLDSGASDSNAAEARVASSAERGAHAGAATAAPPSGAGGDDANRKAAAALSLAKNYISAAQYDAARRKLQTIVQTYANTPAASEAATLLKEIQDK
jgi:hypothetical protein